MERELTLKEDIREQMAKEIELMQLSLQQEILKKTVDLNFVKNQKHLIKFFKKRID